MAGQAEAHKGTVIPPLAGIDVDTGIQRVAGNAKLYRQILLQFRDTQGKAPAQIKAALDAEERDTARRLAHTLKGVAGNIAATAVHRAAESVERAIQERTDAETELAVLEEKLAEVLAALRSLEEDSQPVATVSETADPGRLRSLLTRLREMLEAYDAEAIDILDEIRDCQVPRTSGPLRELTCLIADYEFDSALERLGALEDALDA